MIRGRDVTLGVIVALVAVLCVRLGFWQVDRLSQRRAANERRASTLALPPLQITEVASVEEYRRVEAAGVFDHARQIVVGARPYRGTPGVHVVTPLVYADSSAVLVNRGWLPSPDAATVDLDPYREPGTVGVLGVMYASEPRAVVPGDSTWPLLVGRLDASKLVDLYPYRLQPFVLRQLPGDGVPRRPRRLALEPPSDGPHLGYAIQWFSFAVIAVVGGAALVRAGRREQSARPPDP